MARKEFETLTPQMYYILLVLKKPRHGYDIMKEVARITDETIQIGAGTLYALIPRFIEDGYIRLVAEEDRKKIYQLTPLGERKLKDENHKMRHMLKCWEDMNR